MYIFRHNVGEIYYSFSIIYNKRLQHESKKEEWSVRRV